MIGRVMMDNRWHHATDSMCEGGFRCCTSFIVRIPGVVEEVSGCHKSGRPGSADEAELVPTMVAMVSLGRLQVIASWMGRKMWDARGGGGGGEGK